MEILSEIKVAAPKDGARDIAQRLRDLGTTVESMFRMADFAILIRDTFLELEAEEAHEANGSRTVQ